MADKITATKILGVGLEYSDVETQKNKIQYLKLPNPKSGLTENQIKTAVRSLISNNVIRDPYGNEYEAQSAIVTAYTENQTVISLDIGWADL